MDPAPETVRLRKHAIYIKAGTGDLIAQIPEEHLFPYGPTAHGPGQHGKVHLFDAESEKMLR